jgi:hypothetical protein
VVKSKEMAELIHTMGEYDKKIFSNKKLEDGKKLSLTDDQL